MPVSTPVSLENVRVAAPCLANWENMSGDDRVRHCAECKLNVYNLSEMSRVEAERLIATREGRLCVRFYRRADGTIITRNCPRGLEALIRRVSRIAGAALSAMMSLGTALAQTASKPAQPAGSSQDAQKTAQMSVTVLDPQGAVVSGARIVLLGNHEKKRFVGLTGSTGFASISGISPGSYELQIASPGFKTYKKRVTLGSDVQPPTLQVALRVNAGGETIEVGMLDEGAPLMERDSATVKTVFSGDLLDHIPLR
jgi:Carboxypeptidase regulatory-like domain